MLVWALVWATPAAAQDRAWHVSARAERPIAEYGVPETDDRLMSIHCNRDGMVRIDPQFFRSEPSSGTAIVVSVDGTEYSRAADFEEDLLIAAFNAVASVAPDDPVIDALRRGSSATLSLRPALAIDGDPRRIPLNGSARAIGDALEPCR